MYLEIVRDVAGFGLIEYSSTCVAGTGLQKWLSGFIGGGGILGRRAIGSVGRGWDRILAHDGETGIARSRHPNNNYT